MYFSGQEKMPTTETDSDSGKGTMTSYGSVNSLNTNDGSQSASTPMDNPEQFETQKQQKEIMETGINMWVMKLYLLKRVSVKFRISIRTAVNAQYILEICLKLSLSWTVMFDMLTFSRSILQDNK